MNIDAVIAAWSTLVEQIGDLHVIKTPEENTRAAQLLDQLLEVTDADPSHPLAGLLDLVSGLIEAFESRRFADSDASPAEVLRMLMDSNKLKQPDLAAEFGGQSVVSQVLRGKRRITARQAGRLAARFGVSAALFIEKADAPAAVTTDPRAELAPASWPADEAARVSRVRIGSSEMIVTHFPKSSHGAITEADAHVLAQGVQVPEGAYVVPLAPTLKPTHLCIDFTPEGTGHGH